MFIHDDSDIPRDVMDGINVPNLGGRFRLFRSASVQVVCGLRRNSAPAESVVVEDKHPLHHLHCKHLPQLRCWNNTHYTTPAGIQHQHPLRLRPPDRLNIPPTSLAQCHTPMQFGITRRGWRLEANDMNAAPQDPSPR